jgi:hypothetical protein
MQNQHRHPSLLHSWPSLGSLYHLNRFSLPLAPLELHAFSIRNRPILVKVHPYIPSETDAKPSSPSSEHAHGVLGDGRSKAPAYARASSRCRPIQIVRQGFPHIHTLTRMLPHITPSSTHVHRHFTIMQLHSRPTLNYQMQHSSWRGQTPSLTKACKSEHVSLHRYHTIARHRNTRNTKNLSVSTFLSWS